MSACGHTPAPLLEEEGRFPNALVNCANHPSHSSHKAPNHTRSPTSPPSPLPSIPSPAAEKSSVATHMWQLQPSFTSSQPVHGLRARRQLLRLLRLLLLFLLQVKQALIDRDGFPLGCFVCDSPDECRLVYVIIRVR